MSRGAAPIWDTTRAYTRRASQGDAQGAVDVGHHLLLSHGLAIPRIRAHAQRARIGAALNLFPIFAGDQRAETVRAVERADRFHNRWFLDPLYRGEYPAGLFADLGAAPPPIQDGDLKIIGAPHRLPWRQLLQPLDRARRSSDGTMARRGNGRSRTSSTSPICHTPPSPRWDGRSIPHGLDLHLGGPEPHLSSARAARHGERRSL